MKILAETVEDVKLSPVEAPRPGKSKLPLHRYEKRCMDRIADIERKIASTPKTSPIWLRLRKQKLAQLARLDARKKELERCDDVHKLEKLIQLAINLSIA